MRRNEIVRGDDGALRARAGRRRRSRRSSAGWCCARSATAPCRCPTCRSTSATSCCPTSAAACWPPTATPLPGVYAVGWIKRGPTGILGTNKRDAEETVSLPRRGPARWRAGGAGATRPRGDRRPAGGAQARRWSQPRAGRRSRPTSSRAAAPRSRPRVKLASRDELLAAASGSLDRLRRPLRRCRSRHRHLGSALPPAVELARESAATYAVGDSELQLTIPPDQALWCAGNHDPPLRVSGIQSGVFSGEVGSTVGQQPFRDGARRARVPAGDNGAGPPSTGCSRCARGWS